MGEAWHRGEIGVAEEHLASTFLRARLQELLDLAGFPPGPPVLVTTPPGERHEIGAMLAAYHLRRKGVPALYLGPDTPSPTSGPWPGGSGRGRWSSPPSFPSL